MNAPAPAALEREAFNVVPLVQFAPSSTRTQARRRARFTKEELAELAATIKAVGVMQPILARPHPRSNDTVKYEIVAGERRWIASSLAGQVVIPAVIRNIADADLITLQLTENLQRKTIDQLEEAEGYEELRQSRKINADQVADLLGISRSTVFNRLKLLDLCPEGREAVDAGKLTPSVALLIARLPDPKMQARATKGCLGDYKALGNFSAEDSPYRQPLVYTDAELYIKEEFTTRLEGTATINKAKSEGKPVIAGKEAEEIWKRSHAGPAGYVQLSEHYWAGGKRKAYASALGDNPPGTILIQSPHTGAAEKCLPRDAAIKIFKEKKLTLPHELEPARSTSSSNQSSAKPLSPAAAAKAKAEREKQQAKARRDEVKLQLEIDINIAVFKATIAKSPAKLGKPELIQLHELFYDYGAGDFNQDLCKRPNSLASCTEKELVGFMVAILYSEGIEDSYYNDKPLVATAKRYGVDVEKIRKQLTANAEAKLKEEEDTAQMKAKLVKASPLVKTGKTKIHPKDKWPFPLKGKAAAKAKKK